MSSVNPQVPLCPPYLVVSFGKEYQSLRIDDLTVEKAHIIALDLNRQLLAHTLEKEPPDA